MIEGQVCQTDATGQQQDEARQRRTNGVRNWPVDRKWRYVVFVNGMRVILFKCNGRTVIWYQEGELYVPACINKSGHRIRCFCGQDFMKQDTCRKSKKTGPHRICQYPSVSSFGNSPWHFGRPNFVFQQESAARRKKPRKYYLGFPSNGLKFPQVWRDWEVINLWLLRSFTTVFTSTAVTLCENLKRLGNGNGNFGDLASIINEITGCCLYSERCCYYSFGWY